MKLIGKFHSLTWGIFNNHIAVILLFPMVHSSRPFVFHPWLFVLTCLAGWITEQQRIAIEYLTTENEILHEKLGDGRILLSDNQRRRLAVKGKQDGRKRLGEMRTLFTPDTILCWHRQLVAAKHSYPRHSPGRPPPDE